MNQVVDVRTERGKICNEANRIAAMVNALPDHVVNESYPPVVRQALIENFFANVRVLIEFLGIRPAARDFSAAVVLGRASWKPALDAAVEQSLLSHWTAASKHHVHFSTDRIDGVPTDEATVRGIADDLLAAWDLFVDESGHPLLQKRAAIRLYK